MNEETSQSSYRVASDELRAFIERFERLDAEKKDISDQQKEVIKELKIGTKKQIPKIDLYPNSLHWYNKIDWSKWLFYETSFYKRGGLGEFATLECGEENLGTGAHPKTSSQKKWAKFITEYINETIIKP